MVSLSDSDYLVIFLFPLLKIQAEYFLFLRSIIIAL